MSWTAPGGYVPTLVGHGSEGSGSSAARLTVLIGDRNGPVGAAWAASLSTPTAGHEPFVVVARPGLPVKPWTLFVNTAAVEHSGHGELTRGAAHAGVAAGVVEAVGSGVLAAEIAEYGLMIASVWVDPAASTAHQDAVFINNRVATIGAIHGALSAGPTVVQVLSDTGGIWNDSYEPT